MRRILLEPKTIVKDEKPEPEPADEKEGVEATLPMDYKTIYRYPVQSATLICQANLGKLLNKAV